ncbi:MAG: hypothetical protein H7X89_15500 [Rhizobiales bacterium]|nr:hypothetical protein [Hyphomicrobiales bacterium]
MAIEGDNSISLPIPPPPRPAARKAAIEAAMRNFDGAEEAPAGRAARKRPSRLQWATMHRRPAGGLLAAALIAVVFIPAMPIMLRDRSPDLVPQAQSPNQAQSAQDSSLCEGTNCAGQGQSASETAHARTDEAVVAAAPASPAKPAVAPEAGAEDRQVASARSDRNALLEAPAPVMAAQAPPPPPPAPPPPPSQPEAEGGQDLVVTGSRIPASNMAKQRLADDVGYAAKPASPLAMIDPYGEFLSQLQAGLNANDRRAIIRLIGFPFHVKLDCRTQIYRSSRDVERDFDRIFTPQVRSAVRSQRPDNLINRDGELKGNGRLWFGPSCSKKACPPNAPIRVREVHP